MKRTKKEKTSSHSFYTRLICILLAALVSSGILVYLVALILEIFGK